MMNRASRTSRQEFEGLVQRVLDGLPDWVQERLENVEVLVEEEPPEDQPGLLGLYEGVPLTERGSGYFGVLPDRITLFRGPIESAARGDELERVIRHTLLHEFAHFFGISDQRLLDLDRY